MALGDIKAGLVLSVPAFSFFHTDLQFFGSCYQRRHLLTQSSSSASASVGALLGLDVFPKSHPTSQSLLG